MSKQNTNKIDQFDCEGEAFIWNNGRTEIVGTLTRVMSNTSRMMSASDERVSSYIVEINDENGKHIATEEFMVNGSFASFWSTWKVTTGFENSRKALSAAKAWAKNPVAAQ
tara:strand:- start:1965 stop:2297 length:333 start_codon:yes stop_codon:yes gene_type:complete